MKNTNHFFAETLATISRAIASNKAVGKRRGCSHGGPRQNWDLRKAIRAAEADAYESSGHPLRPKVAQGRGLRLRNEGITSGVHDFDRYYGEVQWIIIISSNEFQPSEKHDLLVESEKKYRKMSIKKRKLLPLPIHSILQRLFIILTTMSFYLQLVFLMMLWNIPVIMQ